VKLQCKTAFSACNRERLAEFAFLSTFVEPDDKRYNSRGSSARDLLVISEAQWTRCSIRAINHVLRANREFSDRSIGGRAAPRYSETRAALVRFVGNISLPTVSFETRWKLVDEARWMRPRDRRGKNAENRRDSKMTRISDPRDSQKRVIARRAPQGKTRVVRGQRCSDSPRLLSGRLSGYRRARARNCSLGALACEP